MTVLVDTSVWIDFANGYPSPQADHLAHLIEAEEEIATCGLVAAEFLQGLRRQRDRTRLESLFEDLTWLTPTEPDTYFGAARLYRALRARGITIRSTVDCLIAILAHEHRCHLLERDRDMARILDSGLVDVSRPPDPSR